MGFILSLLPGRGSNLYKNVDSEISIQISPKRETDSIIIDNIFIVIGNSIISNENKINLCDSKTSIINLTILPFQEYMIVNLGNSEIQLNFSDDPKNLYHKVLYNPYLYENEEHTLFDPEVFKIDHPVPNGYVDTLSKWYSIKFTSPNENYIFIRPGLGISFQTHEKRKEIWEVMRGTPTIISGHILLYNTKEGAIFEHPFKGLHGIINTTDEWILIKETYEGTFEETDITRVFNPNNYQ